MHNSPKLTPTPELQFQNALQLAQLGRRDEAIRIFRDVIEQAPKLVPAHCMLAMLLHESGDAAGALRQLNLALEAAPNDALLQELKASALLTLDRTADAEIAARAALAVDSRRPNSWQNLGLALDKQGRIEESIDAMQSALDLRPDFVVARQVIARGALQKKQLDTALATALHKSLLCDFAAAHGLADDFLNSGASEQAVEFLKRVAEHNPQHYETLMRLARTLHQLGRSSEALAWSERARKLRPNELEPQEMHAVTLIDRGEVEAGLGIFRQLLQRPDTGPDTANRYLILAHYDPAEDNADLFRAHVDWVQRYAQPFGEPFTRRVAIDPQRPLRIGWISPRFGAGPVASFFRSVLAALDRERFHHTLVSLGAASDSATLDFRELSDEWLALRELNDDALLERLRAADFDIVVDLAGHSFGSRLRVLAQRIAPIQLCWLDYFNTTGAPAIDGWISDEWLTPADSSQRYVEPLLRLPSGRFCYTPLLDAPSPEHLGGDTPVFVSFNRLAKLNDKVLDTWATILRRVPDSRLELGAGLLGDAIARARIIERFAERGVGRERLVLHQEQGYAELLTAYRRTDIALDPFPFSGCTTTCDALWMGVPVLTLPGTTFVSRQSASLLWRMGRSAWVASSLDDYIERAVGLAQRIGELRLQRAALRTRMRTTLCDAQTQASELASLFRDLWRNYCAAHTLNATR